MASLAGATSPMVSVTGRSIDWLAPLACTTTVLEPGLASFGTSTRSDRLTLSFMAAIAAATGWPLPSTSIFQPCGTSPTVSANDSGDRPMFCSLKRTVVISPARTVCDGYSVSSQRPFAAVVAADEEAGAAAGVGGLAAKTW